MSSFLLAIAKLLCWMSILFVPQAGAQQNSNLLMVGNSYTAGNSLRLTLAAMIEEVATEPTLDSYQYTHGGYTFVQHWADTEKETALASLLVTNPIPWTWVVLQEQSQLGGFVQFPTTWFNPSLAAAKALDAFVAETGGETIFLMTWGRRNGDSQNPTTYQDFSTMATKLAEGYRRYSEATSTPERPTRVAPAGLAFQRVFDSTVDPLAPGSDFYNLYNSDGSHGSAQGTYLVACVLFATLTGEDPRGLIYAPSGVDAIARARLQSVAFATVVEYQSISALAPVTATKAPTAAPVATNAPSASPVIKTPNPTPASAHTGAPIAIDPTTVNAPTAAPVATKTPSVAPVAKTPNPTAAVADTTGAPLGIDPTGVFINAGVLANETQKSIIIQGEKNRIFLNETAPITGNGHMPVSIFQTHRYAHGPLTYTVPGLAPNSNQMVTLGFAEVYSPNCAVGKRIMAVTVQGQDLVSSMDVFALAGCNGAHEERKTFQADSSGNIVIVLSATVENPMVSFIAVSEH